MNVLETICSRKTVRSYNGEPVSEEELQAILKAAYAAPVGMGQYENLCMTVISDKELLTKIDKTAAEFFNKPENHPIYGVPTLIVISSKIAPHMENVSYSNAAIVTHNMALEATDMGIGACYIWGAVAAMNGNADLVKELKLPEGFIPCCAIGIGKTDEKYAEREIPTERILTTRI